MRSDLVLDGDEALAQLLSAVGAIVLITSRIVRPQKLEHLQARVPLQRCGQHYIKNCEGGREGGR